MRISGVFLLLLTLAAASSALAQNTPYVDPALRAVLQPGVQDALRRAAALGPQISPDGQPLGAGVAVRKTALTDEPRVALFAQVRNESAVAELRAAGAIIGSRVADIVTAEVPVSRLAMLMSSANFEIFEASRSVVVNNDSSMRIIRANVVRQVVNGTWTGTAGSGVIVGVYDTGLDFHHDDFRDSAGQTRVLSLWDQTSLQGTPPPGFSYGQFCSRESIQQVVANPLNPVPCPQIDLVGHGTHVAGTAAGDGSATGNGGTAFAHAGVAPLADLVIVKGGNGVFTESGIIDGLVWLESEARRLNRPMVVNLSLGGQAGPHDGSRLYEAAVDNLTRPGFIAVFSAGNEGINLNDRNPDGSEPARNPNYIHGSGPPGTSRDFTIEIPAYNAQPGACNDFVNISLWYEAADMFDISVLRPDGGIVTAGFGVLREQDSALGNVRIDNGSNGANPRNNAYEADIRINDCSTTGNPPTAGVWTLRVSSVRAASGKGFHFWMASQFLGGGAFARGRLGFDNHYIVGSPGNARTAITVGAFVSKLCWNSPAKLDGPVCFATMEQLGDLARFSSGGPTRDGRLKPEITAPGLGIASSKSRSFAPAANRILDDGVHWVNQGTSMAAPQVTGTIALMLQRRPTLTPAEVVEIFARSADRDAFTTRVYDTSADAQARYWWGHGKLNVCAALGAAGGTPGSEAGPVVITPAADTIPIHATTRFFGCSPAGGAVTFRSTNTGVATIDENGIVTAMQVGTALLIASAGAFADTASIVVTQPASLAVTLRSIAPNTLTLSPRGTRVPLLSTLLRSNGYESIRVTQLSYRLSGSDTGARLILVVDANRNNRIDAGERTVATRAVALAGAPAQIDVTLDSLVVPQRDSVTLIAAVELSGAAPNAAGFVAEFVPSGIRATGTRSLLASGVDAITSPLASSAALTTVLAAAQTFSTSENPVRSDRVVFNYAQSPGVAGIYTLAGRRVADLKQRAVGSGSVVWDLTNDDGERVATGVYVVVFSFGGNVVREKLFVMRGGAR